jgi:hypothetical protein
MAEVLINSQAPVSHQIFWQGEVVDADSIPIVKLYSVSEDTSETPSEINTSLLQTLQVVKDENNPGLYITYIPYTYTSTPSQLRLQWEYSMNGSSVLKLEDVFVVTPYTDLSQACGCLGISTDPSDPNYKSYRELLAAERYARKKIENHTGQKFYLYNSVKVLYGYGSDVLPLPEKLYQIYRIYENDMLLVDDLAGINNSSASFIISENKYGIRLDKTNILDNTVYTANGMVPPSIHQSYNAFKTGSTYRIQGKFGWESVPDEVDLATIELMKDYFSKDKSWKNKYIKNISTFDWDFEYMPDAYGGTGNLYADRLLEEFVMKGRVEIL